MQSWDCTYKEAVSSDYVVGQLWARSRSAPGNRYLLDQVRGQMGFSGTVKAVQDLKAKWPQTERILIEDKANGSAVIDVLQREIPGILPINPMGGKVVRANAVTATFESGNVYIPETAPWVSWYIEEMVGFPELKHDDQVDATTQVLAYYNNRGKFSYSLDIE
jgi:predicted phage terminase large subunit-like protein